MDWAAWSRESVSLMQQRNDEWRSKYKLEKASYFWDLETTEISFTSGDRRVIADFCVVGTFSNLDGTFLWGWADESLPPSAISAIKIVKSFGEEHDLGLLFSPALTGGRAQGLECVAIAGRLQNASGIFLDATDEVIMFFTLHNFREIFEAPHVAV